MIDYDSYELTIEDKFLESTKVEFLKTSTFMLLISVTTSGNKQTVILDDYDVDRIREFLKHWDEG